MRSKCHHMATAWPGSRSDSSNYHNDLLNSLCAGPAAVRCLKLQLFSRYTKLSCSFIQLVFVEHILYVRRCTRLWDVRVSKTRPGFLPLRAHSLWGWGFSRETEPIGDTHIYHIHIHTCVYACGVHMSKMYDKDLVHVIMEVDKSQHLQWDCRSPRKANDVVLVQSPAGSLPRKSQWFSSRADAGKKHWCPSSKASDRGIPSYLGRCSLSVLFGPSQVETHNGEGNLLYSVSQFKCSVHPYYYELLCSAHSSTQNDIWPNTWACHSPVRFMHKIRHHCV